MIKYLILFSSIWKHRKHKYRLILRIEVKYLIKK